MNEDFEVLRFEDEQVDLAVCVEKAEKMRDDSYHLIAPNGMLVGALTRYDGDWGFSSVKETDGDEIRILLPDEVVEGFLEDVEVVEK